MDAKSQKESRLEMRWCSMTAPNPLQSQRANLEMKWISRASLHSLVSI